MNNERWFKLKLSSPQEWLEETPALLYVFDAKSTDPDKGPVKIFETDAFMAMHIINAWESEEEAEQEVAGAEEQGQGLLPERHHQDEAGHCTACCRQMATSVGQRIWLHARWPRRE